MMRQLIDLYLHILTLTLILVFSNSIEELLLSYLNRMDNLISDSQNRVIAGYAREWVSKTGKTSYNRREGTNQWQWNSSHEGWLNKKNSKEEIGSIHAVQGVDINCVGLIIGKDLTYKNGKVIASKENYFDKNGKPIQVYKIISRNLST